MSCHLAATLSDFDAAAQILHGLDRALPYRPEFQALEEQPPGAVAAVDGSHAVLVDNGTTWVVATRAHIHVHGHAAPVQHRPRIHATLAQDAQEVVDQAYGSTGLEAPPVRSAEAFAEALRSLDESRAWKEAADILPADGLLLIDGALEQLPPHAQAPIDRLLARARPTVVGVAKRSGLQEDGIPLVSALADAGRDALPGTPWCTPVPRHTMAHVALLHPSARHAFRIDTTDAEALGRLVPLARDAVYTGYPYPLAKVHNLATITRAGARRLREHLDRAVRRRSGRKGAALLEDFHDVLDRNVPR